MTVGFALCGSFCTFDAVLPVMAALAKQYDIVPILSIAASTIDSRFGCARSHIERIQDICGRMPVCRIEEAEPIGPKKLLDALVIAPCTGNTLAKLSCSIADTPVTMAAKVTLGNSCNNCKPR